MEYPFLAAIDLNQVSLCDILPVVSYDLYSLRLQVARAETKRHFNLGIISVLGTSPQITGTDRLVGVAQLWVAKHDV